MYIRKHNKENNIFFITISQMNIIRYIVMKLLNLRKGIYNTRESYIPLNFISYAKRGVELNKFQSFKILK